MNKDSGLSRVCVDLCGGRCCEPWWGIIIYSMTKRDGLSRLSDFKREVVRGIASRAERITSRYITNEMPPRLLFGMPDRYNVTVEKVEVANGCPPDRVAGECSPSDVSLSLPAGSALFTRQIKWE